MMSKIGLKIISNVLLLEAKMPTGIPIIMQKITAVKIIARVVILSDHKSTKSIKTKLKNVNIANFKPLVRYERIIKIKTIAGKGIKFKSESNPLRTLSIGADSFLKSGR